MIGHSDNRYATIEDAYSFRDGTPAWRRFDVAISYRFLDHFFLQARMENILDLHYRTFASGVSAPGRNLVMSLRYTFW